MCKKCIRECLAMAWKCLIENRVFTNWGTIKNYNNDEEIFECFVSVDPLLEYDSSPDKPFSSDNLFGKGRWKIIRRAIGFFLIAIVIALVFLVSYIVVHINYWYYFFRTVAFFSLPVFGFIAIVAYGRIAYFMQMLELWEIVSKKNGK
ncbi:MAG: hypothetical protein AABX72_03650 [Nanoarchaeota archaeon]